MAMGRILELAWRVQPQRDRYDRYQPCGQSGLWQIS